ncbi:MAG: hypothetical protein AMS18_14145, partial [Gemmatimonas sp. SG8_17]
MRRPKHTVRASALAVTLTFIAAEAGGAQQNGPTLPTFADGQAQIVAGFQDSTQWIREELWV